MKLHRLENKELLINLENKAHKTEVLNNTLQQNKKNQHNQKDQTPTNNENQKKQRNLDNQANEKESEIKPEERFQEIPNNDNDQVDIDSFIRSMEEQGYPTVAEERPKLSNNSTTIKKKDYIGKPDHPRTKKSRTPHIKHNQQLKRHQK